VKEEKTELELQLEKELDQSKKVKHIFRDNIWTTHQFAVSKTVECKIF